jgi:curli production assembly/transport component CsgF
MYFIVVINMLRHHYIKIIPMEPIFSRNIITNWLSSIAVIVLLISGSVNAQDFVYQPVNPSFGGNPYNYSWLLSSADAQKPQEEDSSSDLFSNFGQSNDPLADFSERLQSQILNELTSRILQEKFGDFSLEQGDYNVGNYQINITENEQGMQIRILDTQTGGESSITVPNL